MFRRKSPSVSWKYFSFSSLKNQYDYINMKIFVCLVRFFSYSYLITRVTVYSLTSWVTSTKRCAKFFNFRWGTGQLFYICIIECPVLYFPFYSFHRPALRTLVHGLQQTHNKYEHCSSILRGSSINFSVFYFWITKYEKLIFLAIVNERNFLFLSFLLSMFFYLGYRKTLETNTIIE